MHKIQKYKDGDRMNWDMSMQPLALPSTPNIWSYSDRILGQSYKNLLSSVQPNTLLKPKSIVGDIAPVKTPDISKLTNMVNNDTLAKQTAAASKVAANAKFASTMDGVSQMADNALGLGEGLATSLGANIKEKDSTSGIVGGIASVAGLAGPWGKALGVGLKIGDTLDRAFGKNVKGAHINAGSGFTGTNIDVDSKKFRWTQGNKANRYASNLNQQKQEASKALNLVNASNQKQQAGIAAAGNVDLSNTNKLNNNFNSKILTSKQGSKLDKLKVAKKNGLPKPKNLQDLTKTVDPAGKMTDADTKDFTSGGEKVKVAQHGSVVDGQETLGEKGMAINVIPSGALHAHKNNLDDEADEMTKKGIPVITLGKGDEITQHAEIERDEVILHLTLTQQLEKLKKDGSVEAMIEAGKLLSKELMENTQDNTSLIPKLINNA